MEITTFEDLIKNINSDLGQFCKDFAYKRKELARLGKTPRQSILFDYDKGHPEWARNKGGGTEIQYQIDFHNETIHFGLGFNAKHVPFYNDCSPVDYIKPFVNAYFELKNTALVSSLNSKGYKFIIYSEEDLIIGSEEDLRNIQEGKYYLFGKTIPITNNEISDKDYDEMIKDLQGDLFDLYCDIFKKRNEILEKGNQMQEQSKKLEECIALLTNSHNIILHGAPGTGKTYLAKQIAKAMEAETEFVQFHPSYDYTDFVEGLRTRPKEEDSDEIGFERKDGVFKKFCKKALNSNVIESEDNFDEAWNELVSLLNDKGIIDIPLISGTGTIKIELNELGTGLANRTYENEEAQKRGEYIEGRSKFFNKNQLYNVYRGLPGVPAGGHDNYRKAIVQYMLGNCHLKKYKPGEKSQENKNFVFIIDEINRGEMSKIFGELFFSIDPGYRGEKGKISTQYQNLVDEDDAFYDGFYVPENVYIIGTMNDIDRNVESMDFAIRRRFAFKEIEAKDTQESILANMPNKGELIERMNNLNNAISGIEGLSSAYHIGAAYFLKYDSSFDELWNYHLKPLLQEYLRGMEGAELKLKDLEAAYNLQKQYDENGKEKEQNQQGQVVV